MESQQGSLTAKIILSLALTFVLGSLYAWSMTKIWDEHRPRTYVIYDPGYSFTSMQLEQEIHALTDIEPLSKGSFLNSYTIKASRTRVENLSLPRHLRIEESVTHHTMQLFGCVPDVPIPPPDTTPLPQETNPWGVTRIRSLEAQEHTTMSVRVCVIDTGAGPHSDLDSNIILQKDFVNDDDNAWDDNGHGTHVAGTIGALVGNGGVSSVAGSITELMIAKVLDRNGSGSSQDIADAIMWCAVNGAQVINLSLGATSPSGVIQNALARALREYNSISVCAAGNDGRSVNWPARFDECLAVSALDENDQMASFSSRGPEVAFIAPGVSVFSLAPEGEYDTLSGTSMAAPHVSGVIALLLSAGKHPMPQTIDLGLQPNHQGLGLIDALLSVQ